MSQIACYIIWGLNSNVNFCHLTFVDKDTEASTSTFSAPQDASRPEFDFESLGIYNAPSWSVQLPDGSGGSQVVQVPRASLVEGLPLPANIEVASFTIYQYFVNMLMLNQILVFAGATCGCL